jgi:hypothetical protein
MKKPEYCTKCGCDKIEEVRVDDKKCTIYVCTKCEGFCTIKDTEMENL